MVCYQELDLHCLRCTIQFDFSELHLELAALSFPIKLVQLLRIATYQALRPLIALFRRMRKHGFRPTRPLIGCYQGSERDADCGVVLAK